MKKALLLHGRKGSPHICWFPYMKLALTRKGYEVFLPELPHSTLPDFEDHIHKVEDIASFFGKGDIILGLGLGATLAMQLVEDFGLSDMTIILVGPTYPGLADDLGQEKLGKAYPYLKAYYDLENTIEDGNNTFHVCLSDNDPLIDIKRATSYYSELIEPTANKLDIQLFHKRYHFGALTKYEMEEFPELLQFC